MMYTFKCKTAGDVIMTQVDGEQLLQIIGKGPAAKGIIEVEAVNAAIQALENAVAREPANRQQSGMQASTQPGDTPAEDEPVEAVELHQRIWPLVEMLKRVRNGLAFGRLSSRARTSRFSHWPKRQRSTRPICSASPKNYCPLRKGVKLEA